MEHLVQIIDEKWVEWRTRYFNALRDSKLTDEQIAKDFQRLFRSLEGYIPLEANNTTAEVTDNRDPPKQGSGGTVGERDWEIDWSEF